MRNAAGLDLRRWATTSNAILLPPEAEGITRETGLPASYSVDDFVSLGLFNQWLKEITALLKDAEKTGFLPWKGYIDADDLPVFDPDRELSYVAGFLVRGSDHKAYVCKNSEENLQHDPVTDTNNSHWGLLIDELLEYTSGAVVLGSDGMLYKCKQASGSNTQDPVTDAVNAVWEPLIQTQDAGTQTQAGVVQLATLSEITDGTVNNRVVTLEGVSAAMAYRVDQLVSDGVVNEARLAGKTLQLTRTNGLGQLSVDLSSLLAAFAPKRNAVLTGNVNAPEPSEAENSLVLATTAFAKQVGPARWTAKRASTMQAGVTRAANATELTGKTATEVFVDLAGLETRLAQIVGQRGPKGLQGLSVRGAKGMQGQKGQKGQVGPPGASVVGPVGDRGPTAASIPGEKGDTGPPGFSIPGQRGDRGPDGQLIVGPVGNPGPSGTSIPGPKGEQGLQGDRGDKGDTGPRGYTGQRGQAGAAGRSYKTQYSLSTLHVALDKSNVGGAWVDTNFVLQSGDLIFGFFRAYDIDPSYRGSNFFLVNQSALSSSTAVGTQNSLYARSNSHVSTYGQSGSGHVLSLNKDSDSTLRYRPTTNTDLALSERNYDVWFWVLRPVVVTV